MVRPGTALWLIRVLKPSNLLGDGRNAKKGGRREAQVRAAGGSDPSVPPPPPHSLTLICLNFDLWRNIVRFTIFVKNLSKFATSLVPFYWANPAWILTFGKISSNLSFSSLSAFLDISVVTLLCSVIFSLWFSQTEWIDLESRCKRQPWDSCLRFLDKISTQMRIVQNNSNLSC